LLAVNYERLGDMGRFSGNSQSALDAFTREVELGQKLVATDAANDDWNQVLVFALSRAGDILRDMNEPAKAYERYMDSAEVARKLLKLRPDDVNWRRSLATALERAGDAIQPTDPTAARDAYQADVEAARQLVAVQEGNSDWNMALALGLERLGRMDLVRGNRAAAKAYFDEESETCRRMLTRLPGNDDWIWRQVSTLEVLGQILWASNEQNAARNADQEAVDLTRIGRGLRLLATRLQQLGDAKFYGSDPDTARDAYAEAVLSARQLASKDAGVWLWQIDLMFALWKDAELKIRDSDFAGARRQLIEAIAIANALSEAKHLQGVQTDWPNQLRNRLAAANASLAKAH
jgi:tetratricopeptide (TPR) repeat protein